MKYKVGDKVTVRKDLTHEMGAIDTMKEMCGKAVTIKYTYDGLYRIDGSSYYWNDEMFEGGEPEVKKQTIVSVKDGALKVQYVTNTKKNKVSIQRMCTSIGHIKFDEIDGLIGLLTKLKEEV